MSVVERHNCGLSAEIEGKRIAPKAPVARRRAVDCVVSTGCPIQLGIVVQSRQDKGFVQM